MVDSPTLELDSVRRPVAPSARRLAVTVGVWLLLIPFAGWAMVRVLGLEQGMRMTQVMTFTPYVAILSLAPLVAALLTRRWFAFGVAVLVVVAFSLSLLPRALPGQAAVAGGAPLRVMTLNLDDGRASADEVVDLVKRERVDLVNFQELTADALTRLDRAGMARLFRYRLLPPGQMTNATILSRIPLSDAREVQLAGDTAVVAVVEAEEGHPAEVWAVHPPSPLNAEHFEAWQATLEDLPGVRDGGQQGRPRVLVGDFNATQDHAEFRRLIGRGYVDAADATGSGLVGTWPANQGFPPPVAIDHVLVSPTVYVQDFRVFDVSGSDHRPVVAELEIRSSD